MNINVVYTDTLYHHSAGYVIEWVFPLKMINCGPHTFIVNLLVLENDSFGISVQLICTIIISSQYLFHRIHNCYAVWNACMLSES